MKKTGLWGARRGMHRIRFRRPAFEGAVVVTALLLAIASLTSAVLYGLYFDFLPDDAYYYLVTAINFAKNGFFSIDGINHTNGFHPLLGWITAGMFSVIGADMGVFQKYAAYLSLNALVLFATFLSISFVYFRAGSSDESLRHAACVLLLTLLLLIVLRPLYYLNGMESFLALGSAALFTLSHLHRRYLLAGAFAMLLTMSRLDSFVYFVVPFLLLSELFSGGDARDRMRRAFAVISLPVLFVLVYMAYNHFAFGVVTPIHGALRSTFPLVNIQLHLLYDWSVLLALSMAAAGFGLGLRPAFRKQPLGRLAVVLSSITVVHLLGFLLFQKWSKPVSTWYFSLVYFSAFSSLSLGIWAVSGNTARRVLAAAALLVAAGKLAGAWPSIHSEMMHREALSQAHPSDLIHWMRETPEDSIFAYTDMGRMAFWSERTFVNLDGLVNDFEYQRYLGEGRLNDYLEEQGVRYLVYGAWDREQTPGRVYEPMYEYRVDARPFEDEGRYDFLEFYVYSYLYHRYSDSIRLARCAEVYRSPVRKDGVANAMKVVFDLEKNRWCANRR